MAMNITFGSVLAGVFAWMLIMAFLVPMLVFHTAGGRAMVPGSYAVSLNGTVLMLNNTYVSQTSQNSLAVQLQAQTLSSANSITGTALQTIGGLAFIPAAFGLTMRSMLNIPGTIWNMFTSLLSNTGEYIILPFAIFGVTSLVMSYFIILFCLKGMTPITKTQMEEI